MEKLSIALIFRSTLIMQNSTVKNLNLISSAFDVLNSNLEMESVQFENITKQRLYSATTLNIASDSVVSLSNLTFKNIEIGLSYVSSSQMHLHNSIFKNVTTEDYFLECYSSYGLVFENITIEDSQTVERDGMLYFRN